MSAFDMAVARYSQRRAEEEKKLTDQKLLAELRNINARLARIEDRLRPRASRGKLGPSP